MLLRCGSGFGALAAAVLLRDPAFGAVLGERALEPEPAERTAATTRSRPGPRSFRPRRGASSSCSWTAGRRRSIRSTPSPGSIASTAVRSRSRPTRPSSTTWATCSSARGSFAGTARAASRSATCFRGSERASTSSPSCGRWSRISRSTRRANYFMHTGSGLQGRPSHGAWVTYGLGSMSQELPGFVVLNGGLIPPGGVDCFNSGFLPASFQGSIFKPTCGSGGQHQPELSPPGTPSRASSSCCARSTRACSAASAIMMPSRRRSPTTSWPTACRRPFPS